MKKLFLLEQNVIVRALPLLQALIFIGAASYILTVGMETGSTIQGIAAIACLIAMTLLTGISFGLLLFLQGLKRLRCGN